MRGLLRLENVRVGGSLLVVGVALWVLSFFNLVGVAVLLLAFLLLFIGWFQRSSRWLMPSGILFGIAAGTILIHPIVLEMASFDKEYRGGLFILCCAAGWFLVVLLSSRMAKPTKQDPDNAKALAKAPVDNGIVYWAWLPGSLMVFLGFVSSSDFILAGMLRAALNFMSENWHIALILLGAYIITYAREPGRMRP